MRLIDRAGALAGIGATVLILLFVGMTDVSSEPNSGPEDPSSQLARALAANRESARLGSYLGLIGVFLLVVFAARLYGALREASVPGSWVPVMSVIGGVLLAGTLLVDIGFAYAASELSSYGEDTQVAKLFILWGWNSANLYAPSFVIIIGSSTAVAFSARAFPYWFRWASVLLLVLMLLIVGVMRAPGLATAPGMLWMILASLVLAIGSRGSVSAPEAHQSLR